MLTNRIKISYDMKNIDKDFDIFKVEKANKEYYKCNILDSAVNEFMAAAVQWSFGATALVLFRKGEVTEKQFKDSIMQEYKDVKIQKIDVFDSEQCSSCFYYENRLLAQLLMNSMRTPVHEAFRYNNLTGKLFYHDSSWRHKNRKTGKVDFIRFLEVVIDPGMYLNLEHKTFKRCDYESSRLYVFDEKTGEFRKKLKTDTDVVSYIGGSLPHNHFRVDNFDMTDYAHFRKSKMGVMEQFLRDVKEKLSKYITVELTEREEAHFFDISDIERTGLSEREYGELLRKKGVVIVDENHSEKSNEMISLLKCELLKFYEIEASAGPLSKDAYNIRLIHEEDFYAENEMEDPHDDDLKGYIVQHMVEEAEHFTEAKGSSPAIKKIVQELIIKGDVREKQITIFDWRRLQFGKEWVFIRREKRKAKDTENTEYVKLANHNAHKYYDYYRLKVSSDGRMEFDSFYDGSQKEDEEWSKICYAYDYVEARHHGVGNQVEGLMYSDIDNIHAILLTKEQTLPNISALMDTLKETDAKERVSKEILLQAIEEFEMEHPEYSENALEWNGRLSEATTMPTKKEIKSILNMRTNAASSFNRFLHRKYGIWIDGELRKEEFEATYQISNLLNIKFEYNHDDYLDGDTFVYYVGAKSKKRSYPSACCVRKVVTLGGALDCEEMLSLMAVEFVRNSQYTVVPFPYKYLREYRAQG